MTTAKIKWTAQPHPNALIDAILDENTTIAADGKSCAEFTGCIDTGCYILNALLSHSLYGGLPNNKITALAGESGVGKTFIALGIMKNFLDADKEAIVVFYDTEAAVTRKMMEDRGLDTNRIIISEPETLQKFRTHCIKVLNAYLEHKDDNPPMLVVLDSLGMLSSAKELADSTEGKETRDMTRAQVIRGVFRTITLKLGKAGIPFLLTNHTYQGMGMFPTREMSGGGGVKYASSQIVGLTRSKDREGKEVVGVFLKARMDKSRISKEFAEVGMRLSFKTGLDRYYGLVDLAEKCGIFKKVSTQYQLPDGTKTFAKTINDNPEKYFTEEIMKRLEEAAQEEFRYGE